MLKKEEKKTAHAHFEGNDATRRLAQALLGYASMRWARVADGVGVGTWVGEGNGESVKVVATVGADVA